MGVEEFFLSDYTFLFLLQKCQKNIDQWAGLWFFCHTSGMAEHEPLALQLSVPVCWISYLTCSWLHTSDTVKSMALASWHIFPLTWTHCFFPSKYYCTTHQYVIDSNNPQEMPSKYYSIHQNIQSFFPTLYYNCILMCNFHFIAIWVAFASTINLSVDVLWKQYFLALLNSVVHACHVRGRGGLPIQPWKQCD